MSIIATLVLGVASAIVGGLIWDAIFSGNQGVAWIGSIIVAVIALFAYSSACSEAAAEVTNRGAGGVLASNTPPVALTPRQYTGRCR